MCVYNKCIVRRCVLRCFLRSLKNLWPRSLTYVRIWVYLLVSLNIVSFHSLVELTSNAQNTTVFGALKEIVACQFYLRLSGFHCGVFPHAHLLSRSWCIFSFFYPICRRLRFHAFTRSGLGVSSLSLSLFPFFFFLIVSWSPRGLFWRCWVLYNHFFTTLKIFLRALQLVFLYCSERGSLFIHLTRICCLYIYVHRQAVYIGYVWTCVLFIEMLYLRKCYRKSTFDRVAIISLVLAKPLPPYIPPFSNSALPCRNKI